MITFPLSLSADWQNTAQVSGLSSAEQEWLFEPHSLTAKLKSQSQHFAVKVLSEQKVDLAQSQQALLSDQVNTVLNREVSLFWVLFISLLLSWITAITLTPFFAHLMFKETEFKHEHNQDRKSVV